ncbi:MAG: hydrogen gas-evolving membrane-bound hydrogenase subunit E [Actinomycetota bacterium]
MIVVLLAHVVGAALAGALGPRLGRHVFLLAGLAPLTTVGYVAINAGDVLDGEAQAESYRWVPGLGLEFSFRVDALSLVMLSLVGGIGVLVFVYASRYFHGDEAGLHRFAAFFTAFAGAMTGLVSADDLLLVFIFWELTSVTSYGLIGFNDRSAQARASAVQALIITGAGGLALLAGLLLIQIESGARSFSELEGMQLSGTVITWAAVLVLIGAFTKSAQAPFHGWLPGAMAAPTPVSSYLHSATMVKAGVFLVARLSPAMKEVDTWRFLAVTVGVLTMLWGGYRALRQTDLKLLLAYGTVSQLGMLIATFGVGKDKLYTAGVAMLVAHALFKAALFMIVGVIDHSTHTRQIHELSGLARKMPLATAATAVAALSMMGMIPFFGFVAKEFVISGFLAANFALIDWATAGIVVGSALTTAYTLRFLWGAFADKPGVETDFHAPDAAFVGPTILLAVPTVFLGLFPSLAEEFVHPAAAVLEASAAEVQLKLWPGFVFALGLSAIAITGGAILFAFRRPIERVQERLALGIDAAGIFQAMLSGFLRWAANVTGIVQSGSLPAYLGIIIVAAVAIPAVTIVGDVTTPDDLVAAESWLQVVIVVATMAAAAGVTVARRRFGAVLMLGAVGYGVAALYVVQGAPDLAMTQLLVETVIIAFFVLVLRHLPDRFEQGPSFTQARVFRLAVSGLVGIAVMIIMLASVSERTEVPVDAEIAARSLPEGDGSNIVNVILVDFRGFDTLGEIVVLGVAALGVVGLVRTGRRERAGITEPVTPIAASQPTDRTGPTDSTTPSREQTSV